MSSSVLIIDDNKDIVVALKYLFELEGFQVLTAYSPEEGLKKLEHHECHLVLQDMNFSQDMTSGKEGIKLFHQIRAIDTDIPIIIITAWTQLETAVALVRQGAADYIAKPWDDDKLLVSAKNLIELGELQRSSREYANIQQQQDEHLHKDYDLCGIRYQSAAMSRLVDLATQVANADVPILITGPNGSGKEKIAEIIQANSLVRHGPFIKVNVGALPVDLLEAELFGAEAGAYTGSQKTRIGRFEAADKGTLFLDEIGNLSLEGQMKLLRVLQSGEFERIGSYETRQVAVRVISATNSDLKQLIAEGKFREDLYFRLNVIELKVPPLKQRKADIAPLINLFLNEGYRLDQNVMDFLKCYHWPGNVRELHNVIKRAMLVAKDKLIQKSDFELELPPSFEVQGDLDREALLKALEQHNHVIADTARALNLSRSALYRRLKKFEIDY